MKHNYTSSFQRDGEATEAQKQILIDIMNEDQKDGLYGNIKEWVEKEASERFDRGGYYQAMSLTLKTYFLDGANAVLSKLMPEIERLKKENEELKKDVAAYQLNLSQILSTL